jgi:hypothetical protein
LSERAKNKAKSIRQLLKNKGQEIDVPFQEMLQRYAIERFLFRLGDSVHRDLFVLKGAQMLIVWQSERLRPTLDIDLLGFTENSLDNLKLRVQYLCEHNQPEEDGLLFLPDSVKTIRIKEDADYAGVRITFEGRLENARIPMQIDVGFNDAVTPQPYDIIYPSILGMTEPHLRGYNRETTIAEKFEVMVKLGELNSRMKDFFDIWHLSRQFDFDHL